jgi:hypothetical protein
VVGGPLGSPSCQRASRVPQARRKKAERVRRSRAYVARVGHFDDIMRARAWQKPPSEASISPKTFPHGSGRTKVGSWLRLTCCQRL